MENTATAEQPTAQAPASESPAPVETKPVEEKPTSSKLLELAKKEAEFIKKEVARKEEIAKLQEQLKGFEEEVGYFRKAKETYKNNPEELLNKLGITYDELTEAVIDYYDTKDNRKAPPDEETIRKQIETEIRKAEEAKRQQEAAAAVKGFVEEIKGFVETNKDNYPHLTQLYKPLGQTETPEELLFSIVENYYEETRELLTLEQAAATAEEYFREEWEKLNGSLTGKKSEPQKETPAKVEETVKTENKVVPVFEEKSNPVNSMNFKREDRNVAVNNGLSKRSYNYTIMEDRRDAISKAVAAMEEAARRSR